MLCPLRCSTFNQVPWKRFKTFSAKGMEEFGKLGVPLEESPVPSVKQLHSMIARWNKRLCPWLLHSGTVVLSFLACQQALPLGECNLSSSSGLIALENGRDGKSPGDEVGGSREKSRKSSALKERRVRGGGPLSRLASLNGELASRLSRYHDVFINTLFVAVGTPWILV